MFTDVETFLRYFDGVHRRSMRDIGALPPGGGIRTARDRRGRESLGRRRDRAAHGRRAPLLRARLPWRRLGLRIPAAASARPRRTGSRASKKALAEFRRRLEGTPPEWLTRKIKMIDTDGGLSGWRILMMCLEHEVHHRSQIETYAGLQGWAVQHIYGRSAEQVGAQRERQRELHRSRLNA